MNLNLKNKRALVCGGSKGLGFGAATELAKMGAQVTLLARSEAVLKEAVLSLNALNGLVNNYVVVDMNDSAELKTKVTSLLKEGPIHILINNSGGPAGGDLQNATAEQLMKAFQTHIIAAHIITQAVVPGMKASDYGRIINIVSTSVRQPIAGLGVSNTIRGAMASWSKTLSAELANSGITVNNILPGTTKTERLANILASKQSLYNLSPEEANQSMLDEIPMGRFAEVDEISGLISFLASPAGSYITGTSIPVDGGKIKSI